MCPLKKRSHTVIKEYAELVKNLNVLVRRIILFVALITILIYDVAYIAILINGIVTFVIHL